MGRSMLDYPEVMKETVENLNDPVILLLAHASEEHIPRKSMAIWDSIERREARARYHQKMLEKWRRAQMIRGL